jgi:hypothetical protein
MYTVVCKHFRGGKSRKDTKMSTKQRPQTIEREPANDFSFRGALNIVESAAYCGVRCSAIESAIRDGVLPARRLGRNIIVLKSDLDSFLTNLDVVAAHTPPSILKRRRERSADVMRDPN